MRRNDTVILGLGNTLRGDDGVGLRVAAALREPFEGRADVVCTEEMGLSLLDHLSGFERAILIDSVTTRGGREGDLHLFTLSDFSPLHSRWGNHYAGLPEVAALAEALMIPFPATVHCIGIEVADPYAISASLSVAMQRRLPGIVRDVERLVCGILRERRQELELLCKLETLSSRATERSRGISSLENQRDEGDLSTRYARSR